MLQLGGTFFGTCATAGNSNAKVVSDCPGFVLYAGASIYIRFVSANTADVSALTLNVNGTGAHAIKQYSTYAITDENAIKAGMICNFVYDGTNWVWVGQMNVDTDTIPSAYCTTLGSTAAKVASCSGYVLQDNSYIHVLFANSNASAGALTLNINGNNPHPIYINGTPTSSTNYTLPAGTYLAFYDGTAFQIRTDGALPGKMAGNVASITNNGSTITYTMGDGTTASFTVPNTQYSPGSGISINNNTITNTGVIAVAQGAENGTISVNTGGVTRNISVKGLGSAAYTDSASYAAASHAHGNVTNAGLVSNEAIDIGNGDSLLVADASNEDKLIKTSITFDGTTTNKFLTQAGTWEGAEVYSHPAYTAHAEGFYKVTVDNRGHVSNVSNVEKSDITALGIPAQDTTYEFDGTYNATSNKAATVSSITSRIGALDGVITGTPGAGKTLTAFSETDGVVSATFGNISITKSQVSDFAHEHNYAGSDVPGGVAFTANYAITADYALDAANAVNASEAVHAMSATYALNAASATYAVNAGTAKYAGSAGFAQYASSAGFAQNAAYATTASGAGSAAFALYATSAGYALTSDSSNTSGTASWAITANFAKTAATANWAKTASYAITAGNAVQAEQDAAGNVITTTYATKTEVNELLAANDAMIFKGTLGTGGTITAVPTTGYQAGHTYRVITAGTYAGQKCEVGDLLIAISDATSGATSVNNAHWTVAQTNIDGAVTTSQTSATSGSFAIFTGTTGKNVVKAVQVGSSTKPIYIDSNGVPQTISSYEGKSNLAGTADYSIDGGHAASASWAATTPEALHAASATWALKAGSAGYATSAAEATHAASANYALNATNATEAVHAVSAAFATNSTNSVEAKHAASAAWAVYSSSAGYTASALEAKHAASATWAVYSASAGYTASALEAKHAASATWAANASEAVHAANADEAIYSASAGYAANAASSVLSGTANWAKTAGYALTAGFALDGYHAASAGYAATAGKLGSANVGNYLNPIYLASGTATASAGNTIPYIVGTGTTAGTWAGSLTGLTAYTDGLLILFKPSAVGGSSTTTLNINGLGAKTVYLNNTTKLTTHYPANQPILLAYSTSQNDGCWMAIDNYDSNNDIKVRQTIASGNTNYPILMSYADISNTNSNVDNVSYRNNAIYANPSTGTIFANFKGVLDGTATWAVGAEEAKHAASATWGLYSSSAGYTVSALEAKHASSAGYALNASSAGYATSSTWASSAGYAAKAGNATSATWASSAGYATSAAQATHAASAGYAASAAQATHASSAGYATSATWASSAGYAQIAAELGPYKAGFINAGAINPLGSGKLRGSEVSSIQYSSLWQQQWNATSAVYTSATTSNAPITDRAQFGILASQSTNSDELYANLYVDGNMIANQFIGRASCAVYAGNAGSAGYAAKAGNATSATWSSSADYARNAASAQYARNAASAQYARNAASAGWATYAASAGWATYAASAGYAISATWASSAGYAASAAQATHSASAQYAATVGPHDHSQIITVGDKRSIATIPNDYANKLIFQGLKTNTQIGSPSSDAYSYLVGLRGWSDSSGGWSHELAFNNTGIMWREGATSTWGAWAQLVVNTGTWAINVNKASSAGYAASAAQATYSASAGYAASAAQATHAASADYANKALNDSSGNQITTTYATKTEMNNLLAANDAMVFKGTIGTGGTVTAVPATGYSAGWTYKVITAGTYAGIVCEPGDLLIAISDPASGQTAINNAHWTVVQTNLDGAVTTTQTTSTSGSFAIFTGTGGKSIVKAGGVGSATKPIYIDTNGVPQTITSYEGKAGSANYAANAGQAVHAVTAAYAASATYATNATNASEAVHAVTAAYAASAGYALNSNAANTAGTSSYAVTAFYAITAFYARTAFYAMTAGYSMTAGWSKSANYAGSAGYAASAAQATHSASADYARISSLHQTAKMFVLAATAQAASGIISYSHTAVYATDGAFAAKSYKVAEHVIMQYNTATNALDFIFN